MSMIEYYVRNSGTPWESQHWQLRTAIQFRQQRRKMVNCYLLYLQQRTVRTACAANYSRCLISSMKHLCEENRIKNFQGMVRKCISQSVKRRILLFDLWSGYDEDMTMNTIPERRKNVKILRNTKMYNKTCRTVGTSRFRIWTNFARKLRDITINLNLYIDL